MSAFRDVNCEVDIETINNSAVKMFFTHSGFEVYVNRICTLANYQHD